MSSLRKSLIAAMVAASFSALPADACTFHADLPELSITDRLRWADMIVLARDDGNYGFEAITALRGELDGIEIPFLADSSTIRKLALNPDDAVMFAHDPNIAEWQRISYVDDTMRAVLNRLINEIGNWPLEYNEERFEFFASLHDHPDVRIRQIAHLELDKAPYALLRTLNLRLDSKSIVRDLWSFSEYQWVPFKYLLLGISGDDVARDELHRAVEKADKWAQSGFIGPIATALIESDGMAGLARLEELFLKDPNESIEKLEPVIQAMAIHNQVSSPELRSHIRDALTEMVFRRPETGPIVAKYLADSNDWSQADAMEQLLKTRKLRNPTDIITVTTYLALARKAQAIE